MKRVRQNGLTLCCFLVGTTGSRQHMDQKFGNWSEGAACSRDRAELDMSIIAAASRSHGMISIEFPNF
jgi:hypothetical protein